jgi:putative FmdB family regulatory protein
MPTYEYECGACGHKFEEFQSITAKPLTKCPICKKRKVKRLVSGGAGFIFKGSGFYITDYRSEGYKEAAKKDAAPVGAGSTNSSNPAKVNGSSGTGKTEAVPTKTTAPAKTAAKGGAAAG